MALALAVLACPAAAQGLFEVTGLKVDERSTDEVQAKFSAIANAQRRALQIVFRRLVQPEDFGRLPQITGQRVALMVRDYDIADEKLGGGRYLATISVRFLPGEVANALKEAQVPFAMTRSRPVVVLPVIDTGSVRRLWDDPNPWRDAWAARRTVDGLVPLVLPLGDLSDIAAIGAEQAVEGDTQRLTAIAAKYRTGDTLVAHGILRLDTRRGLPDLEVYVTHYGTALQENTVVRTFAAAGKESLDELLRRAATVLAQQVEDNWKRDNLLQFGRPAVLAVTVRIRSLGDWLVVRKRLAGVAVIRRADLALLSRAEVRVNLHYIGDPNQLTLALEQADLTLSREENEWILGLRPVSSTARARP